MKPVAVVLLIALARPALAQQSGCALLTVADIQGAVGTRPSQPQAMDADVPGKKGERVLACLWSVPADRGQVTVSLGHLPPGMSAQAAAKQNPKLDALRTARYKEEGRDLSDGYCAVMTPPASDKQGTIMSSCAGGVKGQLLSVAFTSPTKALTIAQVRSLLDNAVARTR
jgi:hypothetical protein